MKTNDRLYINSISIFLTLLIFISCDKDDDIGLDNNPALRTIIVYMSADNDLSHDALNNLEEMKSGYAENGINLLAFVDLKDEAPFLLKIEENTSKKIRVYPELNAADPLCLKNVLNEIIGMYPAQEYGLILWSHATSWLPANVQLRSFGNDSGKEMDIPALAAALPVQFDFILFDACLMGSVEVAYELRHKTDYIIAPSTETIADGFPYKLLLPELLQTKPDLGKVAEAYFQFYNEKQGAYRSATISLIDTKELESLAVEMKKLINQGKLDLSLFNRTSVQRLDVYDE